ncbi:hypothetical protein Tco_1392878 [Tanacetum coccineum]
MFPPKEFLDARTIHFEILPLAEKAHTVPGGLDHDVENRFFDLGVMEPLCFGLIESERIVVLLALRPSRALCSSSDRKMALLPILKLVRSTPDGVFPRFEYFHFAHLVVGDKRWRDVDAQMSKIHKLGWSFEAISSRLKFFLEVGTSQVLEKLVGHFIDGGPGRNGSKIFLACGGLLHDVPVGLLWQDERISRASLPCTLRYWIT